MTAMASQITSLTIVYSTVYSDVDKKTSKPRDTGLCAGNSPGIGEFSAQIISKAENVSIWWRHHGALIASLLHGCFSHINLSVYATLYHILRNRTVNR